MKIEFRKMKASDVVAVSNLENQIFKDPWTFDQLLSETDVKKIYKFPIILEVEQQIAGYA